MRGDKPVKFYPEDLETLKEVCEFIRRCDVKQRSILVNEILMLTPMCAWDEETKILRSIESVTVNEKAVQLNIGECSHQ